MTTRSRDHLRSVWVRSFAILGVLTFIAAGRFGHAAQAEGIADQAHSLRSVPADAAFYSASLRLKEQWDVFLASKAYARLMEIPVIQLAKMQVEFQWQQSPQPAVAKIRECFQSPEGQEAFKLARQMFSEEIFIYGSDDVAGLLQLLTKFNGVTRTARIEAVSTGQKPDQAMARQVYKLLNEHAEQFTVPDLVWGFRIQDGEAAARLLDKAYAVLMERLNEKKPKLAEHLQKEQIAGHEFITLRLDGSMIPWDKLREKAHDLDDEQFEQWKQLIIDKRVVVALGVVDEFVLLSVGDSTDHLESFGQGEVLADNPVLARLNKHASERIASIGYMSDQFAHSINSPRQTFDDLIGTADEVLQTAEIDEGERAALLEDLRGLSGDLLKYIPELGTVLGVSYLTPRGYEGFQYNLGKFPMLDDSEPLTILSHVGGNPLLVAASRSHQPVESYDQTVSWLRRIGERVEKIGEQKVPADEWAKYLPYRDKVLKLLGRMNRATREHLFPALADGQQAFVLDVASDSNQWFHQLPKSPKPLPMLELGIVLSVSDAEQLREGAVEYFSVVQDALRLIHEANPEKVPAIEVPEPKERAVEGGALYTYALPPQWGIDSQTAFNGGLTESMAAFSLLPAFTERMLESAPLKIDTAIDMNRAAAKATHVQFAKLVGAIEPWINYGFDVVAGKLKVEEDSEASESDATSDEEVNPQQSAVAVQAGFILPQIHQLLQVAAALRSYTSITYQEDDAWVTHVEMHLKDLE